MTDVHIARAYPDLSEGQSLIAVLGEALDMARGIKLIQLDIAAAGDDKKKVEGLLSQTGMQEEIESADKMTAATVIRILEKVSEQDLQNGHKQGLLTEEDYHKALSVKRSMELKRNRAPEQEHDLER